MNSLENAGWAFIALGAVLIPAAYVVALRLSRESKVAVGAAALFGLTWFIAIADWLPPTWKAFWSDHSLTAGVLCSALAVLAGWMFVDVREQRRRTASMYSNWHNWLDGQVSSVEDWITTIERRLVAQPAIAHQSLAANARAGLMVQQQWAASAFTVFLTREATQDERGLLNGLTAIRRHGSFAIRELASLEAQLTARRDASLASDDFSRMWEPTLVALENLRTGLTTHRDFVRESAFTIMKITEGQSQ